MSRSDSTVLRTVKDAVERHCDSALRGCLDYTIAASAAPAHSYKVTVQNVDKAGLSVSALTRSLSGAAVYLVSNGTGACALVIYWPRGAGRAETAARRCGGFFALVCVAAALLCASDQPVPYQDAARVLLPQWLDRAPVSWPGEV